MNKKPRDPIYPKGFEETNALKRQIQNQSADSETKDDFKLLESLNNKIQNLFNFKEKKELPEEEKKKKIGIIITTLIILVLIISAYYFLIYEPSQEELNAAKTSKLNELHSLYSGPLAGASEVISLTQEIEDATTPFQVETIDILGKATRDWRNFHQKSINTNHDDYNRTIAEYSNNNSSNVIMPVTDAEKLVQENDASVLSKIQFKTPNTVSVPVLLSRLQAGAGLISIGSIIDIYTSSNYTLNTTINSTSPSISGCSVVSIMRCEESGEIDSEYSQSNTQVSGNITNPNENTQGFSSDVLEMLKGSIIGGYGEEATLNLLDHYGLKLSNYERQINLADLDAQYLLLIEVPQEKVNYILDNMDQIILTIPTKNAPEWMVNEIKSSYSPENL